MLVYVTFLRCLGGQFYCLEKKRDSMMRGKSSVTVRTDMVTVRNGAPVFFHDYFFYDSFFYAPKNGAPEMAPSIFFTIVFLL